MTTADLSWVKVTPPVVQREAAARLWVRTIKMLIQGLGQQANKEEASH